MYNVYDNERLLNKFSDINDAKNYVKEYLNQTYQYDGPIYHSVASIETPGFKNELKIREEEWIIVQICDNIPNQKFWNGSDWINDIDSALMYISYGSALREMWNISRDKCTHRVSVIPKTVYLNLLNPKEISYSDCKTLPDISGSISSEDISIGINKLRKKI